MAEELERRRLHITGRVQGVGFRFSTREEARRLGVRGWVRNLADGTVEAVIEAPKETLESMLAFCHRGPRYAEVDGVDAREEAPENLVGFEIR